MRSRSPIGIYAFGRLLLRPGLLIVFLFIALIGGWPWFTTAHAGVALMSLFKGSASDAALRALWRDTILVPWVLGVCAQAVAMRTTNLPFVRMLPDVRTVLARGAVILDLGCALVFGVLAGWAATPPAGIVAFALAFLSFGGAHVLPREMGRAPVFFYRLRLIGLIALIVAPDLLLSAMESFPIAIALNATWISAFLLARAWRPLPSVTGTSALARELADMSREERTAWMRRKWFFRPATMLTSQSTVDRAWHRSLSGARTIDWLRAFVYERLGGRARRWPLWEVVGGIFFAGLVVVSRNVSFLAWVLPMALSAGESPLSARLPYPVSRAERARVRFWGALATNALYSLCSAAELGLVWGLLAELRSRFAFGHPPSTSFPTILVYLASGFAFAAMWQLPWLAFRWPPRRDPDRLPRQLLARLVWVGAAKFVVVVVSAVMFADWAVAQPIAAAAVASAALAVVLYALLWLGFRWQTAKADL